MEERKKPSEGDGFFQVSVEGVSLTFGHEERPGSYGP
jgi:hypothetical protein